MTCSVEKTIAALVGTSICSLLVIKKPVNSDIAISLIIAN
ncbi:hypothetical protein Goshw_014103 [Gossypium schwendimanii]|uniref:Uncharacterized protein n=1 Tax=Gossypium schwendimanii TaxID=34291 RepID=A0A7J9MHL4_GOSSC|nr:hypothetical protein [Gossypium schwendimanii]